MISLLERNVYCSRFDIQNAGTKVVGNDKPWNLLHGEQSQIDKRQNAEGEV